MFGIFDKIEEFFKELLRGGIQANLESMFLDINDKVGAVAADVGKIPMGCNGQVFSFIKSINDSVVIPIAGLIITAVLCIELINMVMQKNNMHDTDTFEFFKYIIKMWIALWLVSHAFTFSMAVFDVAQHMVNKAAGVINTSAVISGDQIVAMVEFLKDKGLGELVMILFETSLIKVAIEVISIVIMLVVYGRMFEIYVYSSVSAIPFATMGNKEWGQIGTNYIKGLFAIGLQGLFLMVCLVIYAVLVKTIKITDIHKYHDDTWICGFAGVNDAKERNPGQKRIKCTLTERKDRMIKRKTVFTAVVIGAGVIAVIDRIKLFSKINDLEERTKDIGRCHNDFCILQERHNKNTDKQIESIQEEIGSVYEHMAELSKEKEDGM